MYIYRYCDIFVDSNIIEAIVFFRSEFYMILYLFDNVFKDKYFR